MNKIMVIDNLLPQNYADHIEETIFSSNLKWQFLENVALDSNYKINSQGFSNLHYDWNTDKPNSNLNFYNCFKIIPYVALDKMNVKIKPIIQRCRSFFLLPNSLKTQEWDMPHIDVKSPHYVFLYYVNDSDGPTCFFNTNEMQSISNKVEPQKIEPKKNRLVIFNGNIYHSSTPPKLTKRVVINFNLNTFDWPLNMNKDYVI